jgi:hypothetical protein
MPKSTVYKHCDTQTDPGYVRATWYSIYVTSPASKSRRIEGTPEQELGLGIDPPDGGHDLAPLLGCPGIRHAEPQLCMTDTDDRQRPRQWVRFTVLGACLCLQQNACKSR